MHLGGVPSTSHSAWVSYTSYTLVDRIIMSIVVSLALHEMAFSVSTGSLWSWSHLLMVVLDEVIILLSISVLRRAMENYVVEVSRLGK